VYLTFTQNCTTSKESLGQHVANNLNGPNFKLMRHVCDAVGGWSVSVGPLRLFSWVTPAFSRPQTITMATSTLTIPANPIAGLMDSAAVRTIIVDGVKRASAFDVIEAVVSHNPREVYARLCKNYPESMPPRNPFKFPGSRGPATPTLDARGIVTVVNLMTGVCHAGAMCNFVCVA
jgi:hypothetical protein